MTEIAQGLTATSPDHHGRGGDDDGFIRSMVPSGGTSLQLPSGGRAMAVTATGNSQNYYIPYAVIQMDQDHNPLQSSSQTIALQSVKLGKTFLALGFQAALTLLVFRYQPPGGSNSSSFLFSLVGASVVCGFTLTLIGMLLQKVHSTAADISGYAGVLLFVIGFYLMMGMYLAKRYGWFVWIAAGILFLGIAYSIAERSRGFSGMSLDRRRYWFGTGSESTSFSHSERLSAQPVQTAQGAQGVHDSETAQGVYDSELPAVTSIAVTLPDLPTCHQVS